MFTQMALLKAIKYCDSSQRKLAELIGENPDKISYWLNRAKRIPFHQAVAIETATNGLVSRYDLAPYARNRRRSSINTAPIETIQLTLSQRCQIGVEKEKQLGNRRGVRSKCAPFTGKTSALAAKEAGFSSRDAYLRVKKVLQQGIPELINAMDKRTVSISLAATIAELPADQQITLLKKDRKEITAVLKKKSDNLWMAGIKIVKPKLFHEELFKAEKKYQLPLRIAFVGLFICCDREGRFCWEPNRLKKNVLPYDEIEMADVLKALADSGFIIRYRVDGEDYGRISAYDENRNLFKEKQ